ncbi:MAG: cation diffusion facilitator family transporter [Mucilaginibacter sp.]|nr:cation diffusion facilitator family transporter [Mucilaginibacter sp.]
MPVSKTPIYTAFGANLLIAATKLTAAAFTGSSAMASEGIHSLVDTSNEVLQLLGLNRSKRAPDDQRPFGYGKELYFWAFIVSLLFFALGGGMSVYEGILHLQHTETIRKPVWNYVVLGIAFVFDGISLLTALRAFNKQRGQTPFWRAVKNSKDPATFVVLFEDLADVIGISIAFAGILLSQLLHNPLIDGIASILIGLLLTAVAVLLVRESRSLLMGESVAPDELAEVKALMEKQAGVQNAGRQRSMYLGPEEVLLQADVVFDPELQANEIAGIIRQLREQVQEAYPHYRHVFIEAVLS